MLDVTLVNFKDEVLDSDLPVVIDFWAPWCGPCKSLTPLVETVAAEMASEVKTVKINVDDAPDLATKYRIRGVPTLILLVQGRETERHTGSLSLDALRNFYKGV